MLSKQQFLESVAGETSVCKHLFNKIPEGGLDYSPGENMRNTLELLRYLTYCGLAPTEALLKENWELIQNHVSAASSLEGPQFPQQMEEQQRQLEEMLQEVPEEDLKSRQVRVPWGAQMSLGEALVNLPLKFLTAYRMQLFLYAKAAGARELGTYNCWMGCDPPAQS